MKKLSSLLLSIFAFVLVGSTLILSQNCSKPIQNMGDVEGHSGDPTDCMFGGQVVQSGYPVTAYLVSTVPAGQSCDAQAATRMCSDGVLGSPQNYIYPTCSPESGAGTGLSSLQIYININGQRLAAGQEIPYGAAYDIVIDGSANPGLLATMASTGVAVAFIGSTNIEDLTGFRCLTATCSALTNASFTQVGNTLVQHNTNHDSTFAQYGLLTHVVFKLSVSAPNTAGNYAEFIYKTASPAGSTTTEPLRWLSADLAGSNRILTQSISTTYFYEQYMNVFNDAVSQVDFCAEYSGRTQAQYPGLIASCYSILTTPATRCMNGSAPNNVNFNIHYSATSRGLVANGPRLYSSPTAYTLQAGVPCPNLTYSQLFIKKNNIVYPQAFQFYTP